MSRKVIEITNLGKQYRLGQVGTSTLSDDFKRWLYRVRGKEDPFLKVGEANDRTKKGSSEYVWALRDINFSVHQGEVVGIIGKNGAGKSTLLKILSRTTTPTIGEYKIKGRVASLLEVGTGFHPDLSGRENVFLNGAIMGMSKTEIRRQFDAIVDFSGVERYIDTPVKRYSSGMYVRLAFAVAAHLESEILIVDEVLAVGDQEFQDKCLGKMKSVSGEGRTVLFVSHNIQAVKSLCSRGLLLRNGQLVADDKIDHVITEYVKAEKIVEQAGELNPDDAIYRNGDGEIRRIRLITQAETNNELFFKEPVVVELDFELFKNVEDFIADVRIVTKEGATVGYAMPKYDSIPALNLEKGTYTQRIEIENNLQPDVYFFDIGIHYGKGLTIHHFEKVLQIRVLSVGEANGEDYPANWTDGHFRPKAIWNIQKT